MAHTKMSEIQWPLNPSYIPFKPFGVRVFCSDSTQHLKL